MNALILRHLVLAIKCQTYSSFCTAWIGILSISFQCFLWGARDVAESLALLHANDIVFGETDIYEKGTKNKT